MAARIQASSFYDLVSGRRRSLPASVCRSLLLAASWPYRAAVAARNYSYDHGLAAVHEAGVPVVSVGNLTVGGTGKTPVVALLARWFQAREVRVAVVSRGYGAAPGKCNDEALELARLLPATPHVQHADRVAAARTAREQFGAELLLVDDGFQHRRLARNLDLVLVDATEPFGFGHVLPRGALREPASSLRRAQAVMVTRSDLVEPAALATIRAQIQRLAPGALLADAVQRPARLLLAAGGEESPAALAGRRIAAFCGIGNPSAFRATLERLGAEIVMWREFPDHHRYRPEDLQPLSTAIAAAQPVQVVCTLKDWVKLDQTTIGGTALAALEIEAVICQGAAELEQRLSELLPRAGTTALRNARPVG